MPVTRAANLNEQTSTKHATTLSFYSALDVFMQMMDLSTQVQMSTNGLRYVGLNCRDYCLTTPETLPGFSVAAVAGRAAGSFGRMLMKLLSLSRFSVNRIRKLKSTSL